MPSPSGIRIAAIAVVGLVGPFVVLWLYVVLLLRAGIYMPHANLASLAGLAFSLIVGLLLLWQLPLARRWRMISAAVYLLCLTPLLIILNIVTVCYVTGNACP